MLTPERRRWLILAIVFCVMVLNYLDRQVVSVLKPTLKEEFAIDDRGYAYLVNVFTFCYACAYPVAGWLADRYGAGRMMFLGVIGWSVACLCGAMTRTLGQLAFTRGLLGIAEPTTFPSQLRVVTIWFPSRLRATANSICASGSTLGAIIAAPTVAWLAVNYHWQAAFIVPGVAGLIVAVLWWLIYRDPPAAAVPIVGDAASSVGTEAPFSWGQLWRTRSLWGILLSRFISDPVWYFCLFWLPGYLQERSGLTLAGVGMVGWIPFLAADLGGLGSSIVSDRLVKRGIAPLRARKLTLAGAALVAPVCILTPHLPHVAVTLAIFSVVGMVCLTWLFNLGVVVSEAFPAANVGSVWGIAGACGAGGAILFNTFVGSAMESIGPGRVFAVMALLHPIAAGVLWLMVRRERRPA
ncbi:MAG TPA: MFS transporter [Opitutaceae bacterium]|nr:MFS transporter [Opitutaceae bacterium]